jgi:hypothetical protein
MTHCPFCNSDAASNPPAQNRCNGKRPTGLLRRAGRGIQWLFPATLLVLMPKCPLCVAAYVALFTGIGISVSAARWIRVLMLACCSISLGYLVVRNVRRRRQTRGLMPL